jgi:hypothetical protein
MTNDEIQTKLTELERRVQVLEAGQGALGSTATGATNKQLSLREFLNQKKPRTANDRGLTIAYYNETIKGYGCFNAEDIKVGFRDARIPAPKNPNDVINKNIAKGYMMNAEQSKSGKKAWVLTGTGLEVIEKGFAKGVK